MSGDVLAWLIVLTVFVLVATFRGDWHERRIRKLERKAGL